MLLGGWGCEVSLILFCFLSLLLSRVCSARTSFDILLYHLIPARLSIQSSARFSLSLPLSPRDVPSLFFTIFADRPNLPYLPITHVPVSVRPFCITMYLVNFPPPHAPPRTYLVAMKCFRFRWSSACSPSCHPSISSHPFQSSCPVYVLCVV